MRKETNNLTPDQFYKKVKGIYEKSKIVTTYFGDSPNVEKVRRGRARIASSECEDLLAIYIAANSDRFSCIHVDLRHKSKKPRVFFPDISLVVEEEDDERTITDLVEIKVDIAWNRPGFDNFVRDKSELLCEIRGETLSVGTKNKCGCRQLKVSPRCNYHVVVISEENAGKTESWKHRKELANKLKKESVYLYTLSSGLHPNGYTGHSEKECVHHSQFELLVDRLKG